MASMNPNIVLLLTGTVNPMTMINTVLQDPVIRLNQYVDSLKWWVSSTETAIVFVENSNIDLTPFLQYEMGTGRLEIHNFEGNSYSPEIGKGFGEINCLKYALENSETVQQADFLFKITGRLKIINILDYLVDFEKHPEIQLILDLRKSLTFCDSRIFGCTPAFISDYILKNQYQINDESLIYLEHVLTKCALTAIIDGYKFRPLMSCPNVIGMSGSTGKIYDMSYDEWTRLDRIYKSKFTNFVGKSHLL